MQFDNAITDKQEPTKRDFVELNMPNEPKKKYREGSSELFNALNVIDRVKRSKNRASWTEPQEFMLDAWAISAADFKWMHIKAYRYYLFLNDLLTIPIIILSSTSALGGVAIVTNDAPSQLEIVLSYLLAIANFTVAILSSIQRYKKYAEIAEQHHLAAVEYSKFYREIKLELVLDPDERSFAIDFAKDMKNEYDRLLSKSPEIPGHIAKKFDKVKQSSHLSPSFLQVNASIPFCL